VADTADPTAPQPAARPSGPEFPAPPLQAWQELAARELKGAPLSRLTSRTPEGVELRPLGTAGDAAAAVPREVLTARPRGWAICQEYRQARPRDAGAAAAEDLSRGADAAWFVLDEALAAGLGDLQGRGGVALATPDEMDALLAGVDLERAAVVIDAGARLLPAAGLLTCAAERRGVAPARLRGAVGGDPLALLLAVGQLGWPIEHVYTDMAELTRWARASAPELRTVLVDASVWHEAGGTAADELAGALAAGLEHLRGLQREGVEVDAAAEAALFVFAVGRDLLLELAKLRAARVLWARVVAACGGGPKGQVMRLHARTSRRELSALDPWVNLVRTTTEGVTAAIGGADTIAVTSLDEASGEPSELGRRLARNIQLLLRDESHLAAVADPVGGSWSIEQLTDALAREAWRRLQAIEAEGGLLASLRAGAVQGRIAAAAGAQAKAAATLRLPVLGASKFATADERGTGARPGERAEAVAAARSQGLWPHEHDSETIPQVQAALAGGAGLPGFVRPGRPETVQALARGRVAEPFERLRARAAAWAERHGHAPKVALVPVGPADAVRPRVEFSRAYFPVGGFHVIEGEATEDVAEAWRRFAATGAAVAVICGTDASYPEVVPKLVSGLRAAGARVIVLAGRPKDQVEALMAAGVDLFISLGGDALEVLGALQQRLEVGP
jgi:methylmalonyl-CoA mutase